MSSKDINFHASNYYRNNLNDDSTRNMNITDYSGLRDTSSYNVTDEDYSGLKDTSSHTEVIRDNSHNIGSRSIIYPIRGGWLTSPN